MKTLTFAETLHPEKAVVHIHAQNGTSRVWGTVMNEMRTDLPVAVAVEEIDVKEEEPKPGDIIDVTPESGQMETVKMPTGGGCFYLEGFLGCTLTFVAVVATFGIELGAAICYCIAAGIYHVTTLAEASILFKAIFMLVVHALMVADSVLLTVSLMMTEILGLVASLVTSIFSPQCCRAGQAWRIYIRKVCHLTRWAFRSFHKDWKLQRQFPCMEEFSEAEAEPKPVERPSSPSTAAMQYEEEMVIGEVIVDDQVAAGSYSHHKKAECEW